MDRAARLKRLHYRAWRRGTREADLLIGGFFDSRHAGWDGGGIDWFESFLDEDDVEMMAWAFGTAPVPARWQGAMMTEFQTLDYVPISI